MTGLSDESVAAARMFKPFKAVVAVVIFCGDRICRPMSIALARVAAIMKAHAVRSANLSMMDDRIANLGQSQRKVGRSISGRSEIQFCNTHDRSTCRWLPTLSAAECAAEKGYMVRV